MYSLTSYSCQLYQVMYYNRDTLFLCLQSLVVSEAEFGNKKQALESARSVVHIASRNGTVQNGSAPHQEEGRRAASWALSFDKMLMDPAGLATFTVRSYFLPLSKMFMFRQVIEDTLIWNKQFLGFFCHLSFHHF